MADFYPLFWGAFLALCAFGTLVSLRESAWRLVARLASYPPVSNWIRQRAMRTPYLHISKGDSVYMERYWLFNAYDPSTHRARYPWVPFSVRLHHIRRPDEDRHPHDHPWNARTIVLAGGYVEQRHGSLQALTRGKTAAIRFGEFHRISHVFPSGAVTLFITGRYRGTWGFEVDGRKVPYRDYLAAD